MLNIGVKKKEEAKKEEEFSPGNPRKPTVDFLPTYVSTFDSLIERKGIERGNTILLAGGCGAGKSTFCMQSLYNGALKGEKGVYLTFEEPAEKLKRHMWLNFGWDIDAMEKKGLMSVITVNPFELARSVEAALMRQRGKLLIDIDEMKMPFVPDRVAIDSISAISAAFVTNPEHYRAYLRYLFESLEKYNSVTYGLVETEQDPTIYSKLGIEEFLSDGLVILYHIKKEQHRVRAVEILKLRCSNHLKKMVPYRINEKGVEIFESEEVFV